MKTNQHIFKPLQLAMLIMAFIIAPVFAFGQQTEPTKRVSVVVTVQSKSKEKELVQVPADNLPKVIHGAKTYTAKKRVVTVAEPKIAVTKKVENLKPKTVVAPTTAMPKTATLKPTTKPTAVAVKKPEVVKPKVTPPTGTTAPKPTVTATLKPKTTVLVKVTEPTKPSVVQNATASNSLKPNTGSLKPNSTVSSKTTKTMVAEEKAKVADEELSDNPNANNNTTIQAASNDKQTTISYVWIGVILIIAGVILGLLFGRTAFLVSFVGVIFILLGLFLF